MAAPRYAIGLGVPNCPDGTPLARIGPMAAPNTPINPDGRICPMEPAGGAARGLVHGLSRQGNFKMPGSPSLPPRPPIRIVRLLTVGATLPRNLNVWRQLKAALHERDQKTLMVLFVQSLALSQTV